MFPHRTHTWTVVLVLLVIVFGIGPAFAKPADDGALQAPQVLGPPGPEYADEVRMFQGIPGIERAANGRLWATWYGGGTGEDHHNYILLATSADNGSSWNPPILVIDPDRDGPCRAFDPCLWHDPTGRLWLFWAQRHQTVHLWAMVADNADDAAPKWSPPRIVCAGVMMCKPIVLASGSWLLPVARWGQQGSAVIVSSDDSGVTWHERGRANVPNPRERDCDEPMLVQRTDGSLWLLIRTKYGIGESESRDGGRTWSDARPAAIQHATARFFIRRLRSGNLLLVKHGPIDQRTDRSRLTAFVSADDGQTWNGGLMLDARPGVSYPDGIEDPQGIIHVIYDYSRTGAKQILLAQFTEADARAGRPVSGHVRLRILVNQATGMKPPPDFTYATNADGVALQAGQSADLRPRTDGVSLLQRGATLFTDRDYTVRDVPAALAGKRFVQSSIDRTQAECVRPGLVYVLTPSTGRNRDSLADALLRQGYEKVQLPEFLLFGEIAGNICSVYQKRVQQGERVEFGKWGVLVY